MALRRPVDAVARGRRRQLLLLPPRPEAGPGQRRPPAHDDIVLAVVHAVMQELHRLPGRGFVRRQQGLQVLAQRRLDGQLEIRGDGQLFRQHPAQARQFAAPRRVKQRLHARAAPFVILQPLFLHRKLGLYRG